MLRSKMDIILTGPQTIHSVHNNGYGLALARTYQSDDYFPPLHEGVDTMNKVRLVIEYGIRKCPNFVREEYIDRSESNCRCSKTQ